MGAVPADLVVDVVDVDPLPARARRALRVAGAAVLGVAAVTLVVAALVLPARRPELLVAPPEPMPAGAVTAAVRAACGAAAEAVAPVELVVATPAAYEIQAIHRLDRLGEVTSSLAAVVPGPAQLALVAGVEAAVAAATSQARTALALARAGDATAAARALDGDAGLGAACG